MVDPAATENIYVDDRELERRTPFSRAYFQHARLKGEGPPFYKIGKRVLYKLVDVYAWVERHASATAGAK